MTPKPGAPPMRSGAEPTPVHFFQPKGTRVPSGGAAGGAHHALHTRPRCRVPSGEWPQLPALGTAPARHPCVWEGRGARGHKCTAGRGSPGTAWGVPGENARSCCWWLLLASPPPREFRSATERAARFRWDSEAQAQRGVQTADPRSLRVSAHRPAHPPGAHGVLPPLPELPEAATWPGGRQHGERKEEEGAGHKQESPSRQPLLPPSRDLPSSTPESGTRGRGFRPHVRKENRRKFHCRNDVLYHLGPGGKVECFQHSQEKILMAMSMSKK